MSNSDESRWLQRLDTFGMALGELTKACERTHYSNLERAGLIKTFELCFELSWNVLKDVLFFEGRDVEVPRAVIRASFEAGYLSKSDSEILLAALKDRNFLVHTYVREIAIQVTDAIKGRYHPVLLRLRDSLEARRRQ